MSDPGSNCVPLTGTVVDVDRVDVERADVDRVDVERADVDRAGGGSTGLDRAGDRRGIAAQT